MARIKEENEIFKKAIAIFVTKNHMKYIKKIEIAFLEETLKNKLLVKFF